MEIRELSLDIYHHQFSQVLPFHSFSTNRAQTGYRFRALKAVTMQYAPIIWEYIVDETTHIAQRDEIPDLTVLDEEAFFQCSVAWEHKVDIYLYREFQKCVISGLRTNSYSSCWTVEVQY